MFTPELPNRAKGNLSLIQPADPATANDSVRVEVLAAAHDQESVVANLFELYAYDLSEMFDLHLRPDGRYGYQSLPLYWSEPSRFPLLIEVEKCLAGFALVSRGSLISGDQDVWDMAEFFVLKRYRRTHVGAKAAHEIWSRFPGRWEVRVLEANKPAMMFWQATIASFTGAATHPVPIQQGGKPRLCFAFTCAGSVAANGFR